MNTIENVRIAQGTGESFENISIRQNIRLLKWIFSKNIWMLKRIISKSARKTIERCGYNISRTSDYYSPLPSEIEMEKNINRWNKKSELIGINYDIKAFKSLINDLQSKYRSEIRQFDDFKALKSAGFGPGFIELDAVILYMMIRDLKPRRYLEVGSGLSTYVCSLAAKENSRENHPVQIQCIEPNPYKKLYSIDGIEIIKDEVQNIPREKFKELEAGDVLFIDSSHILKIDGDVAYLYMEVLPALQKGVIIHIHDIPFPYNTPYPGDVWVTLKHDFSDKWPKYWNEAMLVQAFLAFNHDFKIIMSTPLVRYFEEEFLRDIFPKYRSVEEDPWTFSSLWIQRVG